MGALALATLKRRGLTLAGIIVLVISLFVPHGATRYWLLLVAFLLVMAQTVVNAVSAQRHRPTPGPTTPTPDP